MKLEKSENSWLIGGIIGVGALMALSVWTKQRREFDFANKVVLITGGSGLIGSRLTELLLQSGYGVSHLSRKKNKEIC